MFKEQKRAPAIPRFLEGRFAEWPVKGAVTDPAGEFGISVCDWRTWSVIGISPNSLVAFVGPHSPLAQSGSGTITVCSSSQAILNLQTLLNFMGSPVRYSLGVTAFAKMSNRNAPEHGACTRNATMLPTTDCEHENFKRLTTERQIKRCFNGMKTISWEQSGSTEKLVRDWNLLETIQTVWQDHAKDQYWRKLLLLQTVNVDARMNI